MFELVKRNAIILKLR